MVEHYSSQEDKKTNRPGSKTQTRYTQLMSESDNMLM